MKNGIQLGELENSTEKLENLMPSRRVSQAEFTDSSQLN